MADSHRVRSRPCAGRGYQLHLWGLTLVEVFGRLRRMNYSDVERLIPVAQPQRQDSLDEQLRDLRNVACRLGMYDADDWIKDLLWHRSKYRQDYGEEPAAHELV